VAEVPIQRDKQSIESLKNINSELEEELRDFISSLDEELKTTSLTLEMCKRSTPLILKRIDGKIISISGIQRDTNLFHLCVKRDLWGMGIGTELTEKVVKNSRGNVNAIVLSVALNNRPAIRIYQKCGFKHLWKHKMSGITHYRMFLPLNWKGYFYPLKLILACLYSATYSKLRKRM